MTDTHKLNPEMLKQCRFQIGLQNIEDAIKATKVQSLEKIEAGEKRPTLKQQEQIANAYSVPSWVFFQSSLPPEYDFSEEKYYPEFRTLKNSHAKLDYKLNKIIRSFGDYRRDLISIYKDDGMDITKFNPPQNNDPAALAKEVKEWLGYEDEKFKKKPTNNKKLDYWKMLIENKGVLIFTTSSYLH